MDTDASTCTLCGRARELTFHHLIPRKVHKRSFFRRTYSRDELAIGIDICQICHSGIHRLYDETTLGKQLSRVEALRADPALQKAHAVVAQAEAFATRPLHQENHGQRILTSVRAMP